MTDLSISIPSDTLRKLHEASDDREAFREIFAQEYETIVNATQTAAHHAPVPPRRAKPLTRTEVAELLRSMSSYSAKIPNLPDSAFTRESIYDDHP